MAKRPTDHSLLVYTLYRFPAAFGVVWVILVEHQGCDLR